MTLALLVSATSPAEAHESIAGHWVGRLVPLGTGIKHSYGYRMRVTADGRSGNWRIDVCGGSLVVIGHRRGFTLFREEVTVGRDVCHGGGTVAVTRFGHGLFVHFDSTDGRRFEAGGTLHRPRD